MCIRDSWRLLPRLAERLQNVEATSPDAELLVANRRCRVPIRDWDHLHQVTSREVSTAAALRMSTPECRCARSLRNIPARLTRRCSQEPRAPTECAA